ncbi:MAG: hypothetical protein MUC51_00120 [Anaerolineae bacterium]|nr:hypothetical protein [Anaerolineae bacterium]
MTATRLSLPTTAEVTAIAALADPVARNLRITQCYHELAVAMAALVGPGANWCTVATWASKQAGQSIRKEDLIRALEALIDDSGVAEQAVREMAADGAQLSGERARSISGAAAVLWQAINPASAFQRSSDAVARGNNRVFEEIGFQFARFLASFAAGQPDDEKLAAFCANLRTGEPPEGQSWLRRAFAHYHQVLREPEEKTRAELLLLANLEIGFHEQTRLQPEIVAALDAPIYNPAELRRRLLAELFPAPMSRVRLALRHLFGRAGALFRARDRLAEEFQRLGRTVITEYLMTLRLPGGQVLRLGQDLQAAFPPLLEHTTHPELQALLNKVDPTPDSLDETGAEDWGKLSDRMHFIADLFRAHHLDRTLYDPPFTVDQVAAIKIGDLPAGPL